MKFDNLNSWQLHENIELCNALPYCEIYWWSWVMSESAMFRVAVKRVNKFLQFQENVIVSIILRKNKA